MLDWKYRPKTEENLAAEKGRKEKSKRTGEEKPEGFASQNVKTITFSVMVILFLALFGPFSVFTIHKQIVEYREAKKPEITENDLVDLGALKYDITMDDVRAFKGVESEDDEKISYVIYAEEFIFYAEQEKDSDVLTYTNLRTRKKEKIKEIDIRNENVVNFFAFN